MNFRIGARLFYELLATELVMDLGPATCVQVVATAESSLPEEDCLALARALAIRGQQRFEDPPCFKAKLKNAGALPETPFVLDCRGMQYNSISSMIDSILTGRGDIVVVVDREVAQLGCRVVPLDVNDIFMFESITRAFYQLLEQLEYRGVTVDLPARFLKLGLRGIQEQYNLFEDEKNKFALDTVHVERFCHAICRSWVYCNRRMTGDDVYRWVCQFDRYGMVKEALSFLDNLNKNGYLSKSEIVDRLQALYVDLVRDSEIMRRTVVVSIQPAGKSEPMLLYDLRSIEAKPLAQIMQIGDEQTIIVCFDDVIGSGDTIVDHLLAGSGKENPVFVEKWLGEGDRRIIVLAAVASVNGKRRIEEHQSFAGKIEVRASRVLTEEDSVFSESSEIFETQEERLKFRSVCEEIGANLECWNPLGWDGCEWSIVTDYNVPDCTLPILWAKGKEAFHWTPLFLRR